MNKSPSGLLQHLSTPGTLDFITVLPPLAGNAVILTIIDCFLKAAHFLALSKLPTDLEMAQPLTTRSFHPQSNGQTEHANQELEATLSLQSGHLE